MKSPAIYQSTVNGNVILFFTDNQGAVLDKRETIIGTSGKWSESKFKNITAEYLADTYGEVKSKEHAEFIVKLAEVNDFRLCNPKETYKKWFCFDDDELYFFDDVGDANNLDEKLITIPLPPECESVDEWPKVGDEVQTSDGVGSVKLLPDSKGYYVISIKDEYYQYQLDELSKPKAPEQELRDLLLLLWEENNHDFDMLLDVVTEHVIKKPQ